MFADEARFGRINRPRPCWAPIGTLPEVASQLIREYIYLYGAVCPKDGTCVYLIMPTSNTACFQAFLNVLSRKFARQDILLVLDGASTRQMYRVAKNTTGVSDIAAALSAANVMQVAFYVTPIMWTPSLLTHNQLLIDLNPFY